MSTKDRISQLNNDNPIEVVEALLNANYSASLIVDVDFYEIIYQNNRATEMLGNQIGKSFEEAIQANGLPQIDLALLNLSEKPIVKTVYEVLLNNQAVWQLAKIKWFDNREVIYAVLLEIENAKNHVMKSLTESLENGADNKVKTDSLTRLLTPASYYPNVEEFIHSDSGKYYAIVVFDIDRFKSINDLYGMIKGDEALKYIAKSLVDSIGNEKLCCRMHSDMFSFCIAYEKKIEIIRAIEKIRKKLAANDFDFEINTSFGIYIIEDVNVPVNLMCDRAMMASETIKEDVMNFFTFYDEQYRKDMLWASEIERDMQRALDNHEFKMYLQPKYSLSDNKLCGAEVLARWVHPVKGIISPGDFIPLFEKNGFILKLDEYMWEQACIAIREWIDEGRHPVPISVNISRYHIHHNNLETVLLNLLNKYGLTADMLNLEITESLFLDKPEILNRVLVKLQNLGFKLEVDDFGSGFSSLNLIRNISVDTIKIDKDFLDSEIATDKGKIVVNHTIDMAKDLNLQVIAEGVETKEHLEFLKQSRCDIAQGFFFSKPLPLEEFNKLDF